MAVVGDLKSHSSREERNVEQAAYLPHSGTCLVDPSRSSNYDHCASSAHADILMTLPEHASYLHGYYQVVTLHGHQIVRKRTMTCT